MIDAQGPEKFCFVQPTHEGKMLKFSIPQNDQSVYEITTESGHKYLVRCPGMCAPEDENDDGLLAFLIDDGRERTVMLRNLKKIVSFTRRPDIPVGKGQPTSMYDLLLVQPGQGTYSFLHSDLE